MYIYTYIYIYILIFYFWWFIVSSVHNVFTLVLFLFFRYHTLPTQYHTNICSIRYKYAQFVTSSTVCMYDNLLLFYYFFIISLQEVHCIVEWSISRNSRNARQHFLLRLHSLRHLLIHHGYYLLYHLIQVVVLYQREILMQKVSKHYLLSNEQQKSFLHSSQATLSNFQLFPYRPRCLDHHWKYLREYPKVYKMNTNTNTNTNTGRGERGRRGSPNNERECAVWLRRGYHHNSIFTQFNYMEVEIFFYLLQQP